MPGYITDLEEVGDHIRTRRREIRMVDRWFLFSLVNLHLIMGCAGGNGMCLASVGHGWACPPSWYQWADKCYKATTKSLPWSEAKDECIKMGGGLVMPQSQEETDFLMKLQPAGFWIDCNDIQQEGVWACQDGNDDVEYRNWSMDKPQPDNKGGMENCAGAFDEGEWNDLACSKKRDAICKSASGKHQDCTF